MCIPVSETSQHMGPDFSTPHLGRVPNGRLRTGLDLVSTVKVKSNLKVEIRPTGQC